ncbi:MAG: Gfo/Idh/MocA family oxidoreductase [Gemmataceae bacterium]
MQQAREMVQNGELGEINAIRAFYIQGWLSAPGSKAATRSKRSGAPTPASPASRAASAISAHAYNLGRYISGLLPKEISCHLKAFEPGRPLDDYGTAIIRYENGALGTVTASQITHGRENDVWVEIDGTKASLEWHQENPNVMIVRKNGEPQKIYTCGRGTGRSASCAGHDPHFPGASGRLPRSVCEHLRGCVRRDGEACGRREVRGLEHRVSNVYDGVEGHAVYPRCVEGNKQNGGWLPFHHAKSRK